MAGAWPVLPDWREAAAYARLLGAAPDALAWEWLRRDPLYRDAARERAGSKRRARAGAILVVPAEPDAARWGLHAFEDPALPASGARPVWRRDICRRTLVATAEREGPGEDRFDVSRFAALATLVRGESGAEHWLLSNGLAGVRLDLAAGSLLGGPVRLAYRLAGLAALPGPLATLHALARLARAGCLPAPVERARNRRLVLLLRATDALQAGATQREMAAELLSPEAARARWRTEAPSLRLRAQRLAIGARAMARGGYRALLAG